MKRWNTYWIIAILVTLAIGTILSPLLRPAEAAAPTFAFGLRMELTTTGNTKALLNAAQVMRTDWIAQEVKWKDIEPRSGQYDWQKLDALLLAARPYGFRILLSVSGTPDWARPAGANLSFDGPPADYANFAGFMAVTAKRYAGVINAYEIWPEANLRIKWWTEKGVSPEDYAELLRQTSAAIHAADATSLVISGGLAPTGANDNVNVIDDLSYYQRLYTVGVINYVDALGARIDGYNNPPADTPTTRTTSTTTHKGHTSFYFRHYEDIRAIMVANGDTHKSLWITSAGWASAAQPAQGMEYAADVSEEQQANYLVEALAQVQSQSYVAVIIINNFNYSVTPGVPPELAPYSFLRADWSARPAFITLAQVRQGDAFTRQSPTSQPIPKYVLPNWRPRLRYTFQTGQP